MIVVSGRIEVGSADDIARVEDALMARMERSRKDAGCLAYSFSVEVGAPNILHVIEKWESEELLDAHLKVPDEAFSKMMATANIKSASVIGYTTSGERVLL